MPDELNGKLEKWYETKLAFLAAVFFPLVIGTVTVVLYIGAIQTTLAVQQQEFADFKNNDITHIELEITEIKAQEALQQQQMQTLQDKVTQAITILDLIQKK
ncbi:MAG: hypothetical protein ACREGC_00375 [Minisyncoccia bacterium]